MSKIVPIEHKIRHLENRIRKVTKRSDVAYKKSHNITGVMLANRAVAYERHLNRLLAIRIDNDK